MRSEDRGVSPDKVKRGAGGSRAHPTAPDPEQGSPGAGSSHQDLHPSAGVKVMGKV